eukprot:scaffold628899_cov18-Prasinocladus_malaysianus.AAC.1
MDGPKSRDLGPPALPSSGWSLRTRSAIHVVFIRLRVVPRSLSEGRCCCDERRAGCRRKWRQEKSRGGSLIVKKRHCQKDSFCYCRGRVGRQVYVYTLRCAIDHLQRANDRLAQPLGRKARNIQIQIERSLNQGRVVGCWRGGLGSESFILWTATKAMPKLDAIMPSNPNSESAE